MKKMNTTEEILMSVIISYNFKPAEKLRLLASYKEVIRPQAWDHLFYLVFFTEEFKIFMENRRKD